MNDRGKMEILYLMGLKAYPKEDYSEVSEDWEDLWFDYYFKDRRLIRRLSQLFVRFFHLQNKNLIGV